MVLHATPRWVGDVYPQRLVAVSLVFGLTAGLWASAARAQDHAEASSPSAAGQHKPASEAEPSGRATNEGQQTALTEPASDSMETIVVGSRRVTRSEVGSPTPVDVIDVSEFANQGSPDMDDMLRTLVPSYNVTQQPIRDAATLIRPASLRGLPPDNTVVLVNGKRRHRGSVITFIGGGIADGAHGVDISSIPSIALKRVEVLRDGAAAQYGSDAIAGVMNFVLKDSRDAKSFELRYGQYYAGDGQALTLAGNVGLPVTDDGFLNLSLEYGNSNPTDRSVQRTDATNLIARNDPALSPFVANPAQIWGAPQVRHNLKLFANSGLDLGDNLRLYLFGNYAQRTVEGGFYYRNPEKRAGVFKRDAPVLDPTGRPVLNPDGTPQTIPQHLVADLTPHDNRPCLPFAPGDTNGLAQVGQDPNCFAFNQWFPGGFTPRFGGIVRDWSVTAGVRGATYFGLIWDLSAGVGRNSTKFKMHNTVNASLGPLSPTRFMLGKYTELDTNVNLDAVMPVALPGLSKELNIAGGLEFRNEQFAITPGDEASYMVGLHFREGFSVGSNGFQGFSPEQAEDSPFNRKNVAAYVDLELDPIQHWRTGLAGRVERFDTFGSTANFKASTRYGFADLLSVRASAGTGFRAPTAGQANVTNTGTVARPDGTLENRGTIPPTSPVAVEAGGRELQPERSLNAAAGIVLDAPDFLSHDLALSIDYYRIQVRDRISLSGEKDLRPDQITRLMMMGITGARSLQKFRYYANAFDTRTQGLDVVATFKAKWKGLDIGNTDIIATYNWNQTQVMDGFDATIIDDERINQIENSLPQHRFVLVGNHVYGPARVLARLKYFGSFRFPENYGTLDFGGRFLFDLEAAYSLFGNYSVVAGVQNLLNTFPALTPDPGAIGAQYPENAPTGFNGGFWYVRLLGRY